MEQCSRGIEVALAVTLEAVKAEVAMAVETLHCQGDAPFEAGLSEIFEMTSADAAWAKETQLPHVDPPGTAQSLCLHATIGWWSIRMRGNPTSYTDNEVEPYADEIQCKAGRCADLDAPSI